MTDVMNNLRAPGLQQNAQLPRRSVSFAEFLVIDVMLCAFTKLRKFFFGTLLTANDRLTCTDVDIQCGPDCVSTARRGDYVDTAIEPVAGHTLERDAAVVLRRRD